MMNVFTHIFRIYLAAIVISGVARADFFEIKDIRFHDKPPRDEMGVWDQIRLKEENRAGKDEFDHVFRPCFELEVEVEKTTRKQGLVAKLYLMDGYGSQPVAVLEQPDVARKPGEVKRNYRMPAIFKEGESYSLFFGVPDNLLEQAEDLHVLAVFGDSYSVAAESYPTSASSPSMLEFAEKKIFLNPVKSTLERKEVMDPVSEIVVETDHPRHPQITMMVRAPEGITHGSEAKGMLAWCVLAGRVEEIRRLLQGADDSDEINALKRFADKHQLAILAWGSRRIWNAGKNYDEYTEEGFEELDESFEEVADAWEKGVGKFHQKYGLPRQDFFLVGSSGAAQWAHRLALRKPQFFHAVQIHIPSSFDKPTPEASNILWCLTTGELESGYERSKRFFMDCRELGYPIIYKAYIGLGHSGSPASHNMRRVFLEYAWKQLSLRRQQEAAKEDSIFDSQRPPAPWLESFRNPEFVGDIVNQELYPVEDMEMVPKGFQVALPNQKLANAWERHQ